MKSGILNKVNGKFYIGSATNFSNLKNNTHTNSYLQRAWNKYWSISFEFIILETCEKEKLVEREQYWIDITDCCNPKVGYNILKVARSAIGAKRSTEAKAKMSAWQVGRVMSDEAIEKMRISKRKIDKWPHANGCRCKCHECNYKRSEYSLVWVKAKNLAKGAQL